MTQRDVKTADVGAEIDKLAPLDEKLKKANAAAKAAKEAFDEQKEFVMEVLAQRNLDGGKGKKKSVTIGEEEVGQIKDAEKFWNFVHRNKANELLQNRISNPAYRELLQVRKGRPIPGVETVKVKKLYIHSR